jgi:hypothetical protein
MELIFAALGLVAVVLLLRWLFKARESVQKTFWLSQDGECEPTGPYTVAQIVSLWRQGQITARGMVTAEHEEKWFSIMKFAHHFDPTADTETSDKARRNAIALLALVITLVCVMVATPVRYEREPTLGERIRELENSPRGQQLKAEAYAEWMAEKRQKAIEQAAASAQIQRALDIAAGRTPTPPPLNPNEPPPAMLAK